MSPNEKYPTNSRSFFTNRETKAIGGGIVLWRGYFQSVRPSIGRLLINVDISTAMMYKGGPLIGLCLDFFDRGHNPSLLFGGNNGIPDRERLRLEKFLSGVRVLTPHTNGNRAPTPRVVKKLSRTGSNQLLFAMNGHGNISVANYFAQHRNRPLQYPQMLCVEVSLTLTSFSVLIQAIQVGAGTLLPLELCNIPHGQIVKKQVPQNKTKDFVEFSTMKPRERFQSILNGREVMPFYL
jgi:eukaryotic translation initiation factor 2C